MSSIRIQTVSLAAVPDKQKNLDAFCRHIEKAAGRNVDLIVFPELSLSGIHSDSSIFGYCPESIQYVKDVAEYIPEGDSVQKIISLARKHNMYVCWTMSEKDRHEKGRYYNTCVLVGPEGFVGSYRKVNPAGTEAFEITPGNSVSDVFDTEIGKIGLAICFDKVFPSTLRPLKIKGAEIVIIPTAWPGIHRALGKKDLLMQFHRYCSPTRATETGMVIVDTNLTSPEGHDLFPEGGHSAVVSPLGKRIKETGWYEESVIVDIDPQKEIENYYRRTGFSPEKHIRMLETDQKIYDGIHNAYATFKTVLSFVTRALAVTLLDGGRACFYRMKTREKQ